MTDPQAKTPVSLGYLFITFLKIGATAFGGFMALISVVQQQLVQKDKVLDDEVVYEGIAITSLMPGPMAVNTITFIGYHLRGWVGAFVCMSAVLLPTFLLMLGFTHYYLKYNTIPQIEFVFITIIPVIVAIILVVAFQMGKKYVTNKWHWTIAIIVFITTVWINSFEAILLIFLLSGLAGIQIDRFANAANTSTKILNQPLKKPIFLLAFLAFMLVLQIVPTPEGILWSLGMVFSKVSLTLFGGGYVMVPILQNLVVEQLSWLTTQQFVDAIALGQLTPGPILISAAFVGYKLQGFLGALIATIAIFFPSALLTVFVSHYYQGFKDNPRVKAIFTGIRPAVVGMIASAALLIGNSVSYEWWSVLIGVAALVLLAKYRINAIYLILGSLVLGLLIYILKTL
ncbi:MAG: chromate efflux transporter [Cyclobacteriaceae bacterium]